MQIVAEIKKKLLGVIFTRNYGPTSTIGPELVPGSSWGVLSVRRQCNR